MNLKAHLRALLEPVRALEEKATKGPWEHDCDSHYDRGERQHFVEHHISGVDRDRVCTANHFDAQEITPNDHGVFSDEQARHDFRFIVELRNVLPQLLALVDAETTPEQPQVPDDARKCFDLCISETARAPHTLYNAGVQDCAQAISDHFGLELWAFGEQEKWRKAQEKATPTPPGADK